MPLADLLLAACGVGCVHLLATAGNFSEQFRDWSLPFERQQIDELPLTFAALFASMAWFAWRRWREAAALAGVASFERGEALAASRMREQLARHLINVQEDERAALARELHDEFGQRCNAISVEAAWLRSAAGEKIDIAECAARIAAEADALGQVVRSRLRVLRPATLDLLGLRAALQEHCSAWSRRHGIACVLAARSDLPDCGPALGMTVFRIVQEALTNVARHAEAGRVELTIAVRDAELLLSIVDDGKGMAQARRQGLGLIGMEERARMAGGSFALGSEPGHGTRIDCRFPLAAAHDHDAAAANAGPAP